MSSTKNTKQSVQPKLRFPEFRDKGGWERQPLEKFLDYQQPTPYLVTDTNYSKNYGTPVLTAGKTFLLGYTNEQHGIFKDGLPVIIFDDFTTATQFVDFPFKAKSSAMKILQAKNEASIKFMYEVLQMISYEVGAHERHWISKFAPMLVPVPVEPAEQYRITDCLSSLDALIAAQAQKVEALKAHKKGLMQELFPAEGETLPKLRFLEFKGKGEWEEKPLKAFLKESRILGSSGDIAKKITVKLWGKGVFEKEDSLKGSPNTQYYRRKAGQFIYSKLDFLNQAFGIVPDHLDGFESTVDLPCFEMNEGIIPIFLLEYVKRKEFYEILGETADGSRKARRIHADTFLSFSIFLPSTEEQQKIADCLSSLDTLITAQSHKLDALRQYKKGLMQQLFPTAHEVQK